MAEPSNAKRQRTELDPLGDYGAAVCDGLMEHTNMNIDVCGLIARFLDYKPMPSSPDSKENKADFFHSVASLIAKRNRTGEFSADAVASMEARLNVVRGEHVRQWIASGNMALMDEMCAACGSRAAASAMLYDHQEVDELLDSLAHNYHADGVAYVWILCKLCNPDLITDDAVQGRENKRPVSLTLEANK